MIWGVPGIAIPQFIFIYLQKILEKNFKEDGRTAIYETGKQVGFRSTEMLKKRFGYSNPSQLFKTTIQQIELVGFGKVRNIRVDIKRKHFSTTVDSNIAKEYLKISGIQKEPVCHYLRGAIGGAAKSITGEDLPCIEIMCMSMGKSTCEFVVKPLKDWDSSDALVKGQLPSKIDTKTDLEIPEKAEIFPKRY